MRRRTRHRRAGKGPNLGRLLIALVVTIAVVAIAVVVVRQFSGYFAAHKPARRIAAAQSPSPMPTPVSTASAAATASPSTAPSVSPGSQRVAIIIDDCGYDLKRDLRFLDLKVPVTFSILPMTPHGAQVAAAAKAAGQSVILHLPMEPLSLAAHPGPGEITTEMTDDQVRAQVSADIASLPRMPGANNHEGSKATSDPRVMRDVLGVFKTDGMFYIDSRTALTSVGESTAQSLGVPTAHRDVFLDDQTTVPYVEGQIKQLEAVARRNGVAIAIGHPFPQTAEALEVMVPRMQADGFTFVTAQSLVK